MSLKALEQQCPGWRAGIDKASSSWTSLHQCSFLNPLYRLFYNCNSNDQAQTVWATLAVILKAMERKRQTQRAKKTKASLPLSSLLQCSSLNGNAKMVNMPQLLLCSFWSTMFSQIVDQNEQKKQLVQVWGGNFAFSAPP